MAQSQGVVISPGAADLGRPSRDGTVKGLEDAGFRRGAQRRITRRSVFDEAPREREAMSTWVGLERFLQAVASVLERPVASHVSGATVRTAATR